MFQKELNCEIGFSDHTLNSKAACVATAMGVSFIEKHFTLNKEMDGFDHKYASSPDEFEDYVKDPINTEKPSKEDIFWVFNQLIEELKSF